MGYSIQGASQYRSRQFTASLQGETGIDFCGPAAGPIERGTALVGLTLGLLSIVAAATDFYRCSLDLQFLHIGASEVLLAGFCYLIFGYVLRKLGFLVLSEMEWHGIVFLIQINGAYGERREDAVRDRGREHREHYESGMRTSYRCEVYASAVKSSSFAIPPMEDRAFERFITGSVPEVDLVAKIREAIARNSNVSGMVEHREEYRLSPSAPALLPGPSERSSG